MLAGSGASRCLNRHDHHTHRHPPPAARPPPKDLDFPSARRLRHSSLIDRQPRISAALPQLLLDEAQDVVVRYAARAEELGFAGLWSLDSVPGSATSRVPLLDGLHLLTTAAAVTGAIGLGIAVIVLPARNPAQLAKEIATIDRLSAGRLIVALGIGRKEPTAAGLGLPTGH